MSEVFDLSRAQLHDLLGMLNCRIVFQTSYLFDLKPKKAQSELHTSSMTTKASIIEPFSGFPRASVHRPFSPHKSLSADLPPEHQTIWPGQRYQITRPLLIILYDSSLTENLTWSYYSNRLNFIPLVSALPIQPCVNPPALLSIRTFFSFRTVHFPAALRATTGGPALPGDIYEIKQRSMDSQQSRIGNGRMLSLTQSRMRTYHLCGPWSSCPQQSVHQLHSCPDHQGKRSRYQSTAVIHKSPDALSRGKCQFDTALSSNKAMFISTSPSSSDVDRIPLV